MAFTGTGSPKAPTLSAPSSSGDADDVMVILRAYEGGHVGLVQAADKVEQALERLGLLSRMQLSPLMVGCDTDNRGSQGVNALEVGILASDICEVGWSWDETRHAVCIEAKPGRDGLEAFNAKLASGTDLAPVRPGSIRFGALSCSHNSMGLRSIAAAMPSTDPLMSSAGAFSIDRLELRDAEYAKAVRSGLHWKVLNWQVREKYPGVTKLISLARNVGQAINRTESEMQVLLRLHSMSVQLQTADGTVVRDRLAHTKSTI